MPWSCDALIVVQIYANSMLMHKSHNTHGYFCPNCSHLLCGSEGSECVKKIYMPGKSNAANKETAEEAVGTGQLCN